MNAAVRVFVATAILMTGVLVRPELLHAQPSLDSLIGSAFEQIPVPLPNGIPNPLQGGATGGNFSPLKINVIRWKPASDSDGRLVVLVGPYDITVKVNGEIGKAIGPSNGYGTTARFRLPGCAYAAANVEFFDSIGRPVRTYEGKTSVQVSGCSNLRLYYGPGPAQTQLMDQIPAAERPQETDL